jgi:hypothetical protein
MSKKELGKLEIKGIKDKYGIVSTAPPPKPQQVVKNPIVKGKNKLCQI